MPLVVRRVRVADVPILEALEAETCRRFPARRGWLESYRSLVEAALREEPEGLLVADFEGRTVGAAIVRQRGRHAVRGDVFGHLEALTVAPGWFGQGVHERLLKEAEAYLKARGCQRLTATLPTDADVEAELFRQAGFSVASWELERAL